MPVLHKEESNMDLSNINYLAVLVAALSTFILGRPLVFPNAFRQGLDARQQFFGV